MSSECDRSRCHLIDAKSIKAYYHSVAGSGRGVLTIEAQGEAECAQCVAIVRAPMQIEPPEFNLQTCACVEITISPYWKSAAFSGVSYSKTVTVYTASGPQQVPVEALPAVKAGAGAAPEPAVDNEVIGLSPNSIDVDRAIRDAVSQLRTKYPDGVNAKVTEIGFWAFGKPVGLAALYVRMQQKES